MYRYESSVFSTRGSMPAGNNSCVTIQMSNEVTWAPFEIWKYVFIFSHQQENQEISNEVSRSNLMRGHLSSVPLLAIVVQLVTSNLSFQFQCCLLLFGFLVFFSTVYFGFQNTMKKWNENMWNFTFLLNLAISARSLVWNIFQLNFYLKSLNYSFASSHRRNWYVWRVFYKYFVSEN